jgi:hypothetical protein
LTLNIVAIAQGHLIDVAIGIGDPLLADATRPQNGGHATLPLEVSDPFIQGGVRLWLASKQKVGVLSKHPHIMRRGAVQIVTQIGDAPCGIVSTPLIKPATGCGQLAVLFVMTVLRLKKLWGQRHPVFLPGRYQTWLSRNDGLCVKNIEKAVSAASSRA